MVLNIDSSVQNSSKHFFLTTEITLHWHTFYHFGDFFFCPPRFFLLRFFSPSRNIFVLMTAVCTSFRMKVKVNELKRQLEWVKARKLKWHQSYISIMKWKIGFVLHHFNERGLFCYLFFDVVDGIKGMRHCSVNLRGFLFSILLSGWSLSVWLF